MLDLDEIKRLHDKAFTTAQQTREQAANDMVFAYITQWDDEFLDNSQLQFRGEFYIVRKATRDTLAQLNSRPVQVDFEPIDTMEDKGNETADLMDGLYRTTTRKNISRNAFQVARQESVVCGFGAWELDHDYIGIGNLQEISRLPVWEANNTLFWDPNAKLDDKSDATYCSRIAEYSEDAYRDIVSDMLGIPEDEVNLVNFKTPEQDYTFPWIYKSKIFYIGYFYYRHKEMETLHIYANDDGDTLTIREEHVDARKEELKFGDFQLEDTIERERFVVYRYIVTGDDVLEETRVPGEHIPVVPMYGERQYIEGVEHYEGVVRLAKDPQRLRNFQLSYLADIASRSPRVKPIFWADQVRGYSFMYEENGSNNNYPYLLTQRYDTKGVEMPAGPIATMPDQPIPQALAASIDLSRQAVEDVATTGAPENISDPDLSGKAIFALKDMMDQQTAHYQTNYKTALRRDAEIFASMAAEIYDTPRQITLTGQDNKRSKERLMKPTFNQRTGQIEVKNDLTTARFEIYAEIGEDYQTQEQEVREDIKEMITILPPEDPVRNILLLMYFERVPGSSFKDLRKFATNQLIRQGIKEPETEEEQAVLQQAQEAQDNQQPDANTLLAMAEMEKAKADQMKAEVSGFDAQTKRLAVGVKAHEVGAKVQDIMAATQGKKLDNIAKIAQGLRPPPLQQQQR